MKKMATEREKDHERIRAVCAQVPLIDAHAHNVVAMDSTLPFLQCFSEARGHEALSSVPHSLSFQVRYLHRRPGRVLSRPQFLFTLGALKAAKNLFCSIPSCVAIIAGLIASSHVQILRAIFTLSW